MKLDKSLLKTIAVGIAVVTLAPSCEKIEEAVDQTNETILERTGMENPGHEGGFDPANCPACGMG
jgi:hypothetical protein